MVEYQTFDILIKRMLSRIPDDLDKREGSIIYNAIAPAAAELAQAYVSLEQDKSLAYADTATGEYLERRTAEYGVNRERKTKALKKGQFFAKGDTLLDIPLGSRFTAQNTNFTAVERLAAGEYVMEAETAGRTANRIFGTMIPIDYIPDLARAVLTGEVVPGEDDETDEALRKRYLEAINEQPFGGNVADYRKKINSLAGVGGVKVFPVWQGGGTVKCVIITSEYNEPSASLVESVQTIVDPVVSSGEGIGMAPIGHRVTIAGASGVSIEIETNITLASYTTISQVRPEIEAVIEAYFLSLRKLWKDEERLIVRVSQIEARILAVAGVTDITVTRLNGSTGNVELEAEEIPVKGTVTLHG
ncbi:baseplate J/gp47 family protein [Paenibacillus sp. FJAT-26967]|uniref:baseplate J/gp47 family protein n=1 Tax=Paenibacillus sp. FJAT-26967 TaxID=1729690 RepID=UPI0008382757|nr:baseplate J/gp47 family protein [Paenibacillus sp. FJAT-26967]